MAIHVLIMAVLKGNSGHTNYFYFLTNNLTHLNLSWGMWSALWLQPTGLAVPQHVGP